MRNIIVKAIMVGVLCSAGLYSQWGGGYNQMSWRSTKGSYEGGYCSIEKTRVKVTVNRYHLDIEEEVEIGTSGYLWGADSSTLEIFGEFNLTPGTAVRSLLLWNGEKILKAKLIDRNKADSTMDHIVNYTYRDPALIRYEGAGRYSYRIYPVAINQSRKIRVLYSVPINALDGRFGYSFQTAFTANGNDQHPTDVEVEVVRGNCDSASYFIETESLRREIVFGGTYLLPYSELVLYSNYPKVIRIIPQDGSLRKGGSVRVKSGAGKGYYSILVTGVPDEVTAGVSEMADRDVSIEAVIPCGTKQYITEVALQSKVSLILKTEEPWAGSVTWNVYNRDGGREISHLEKYTLTPSRSDSVNIPLLWASKYSLEGQYGNLGGVYGFVDRKMSLLALERDSLTSKEAEKWRADGVPLLTADEIIPDTANMDAVPVNSVIIESVNPTALLDKTAVTAADLRVSVRDGRVLHVSFAGMTREQVSVAVYTVTGKLVARFDKVGLSQEGTGFRLSEGIGSGMFVVRVTHRNFEHSQRIVLK